MKRLYPTLCLCWFSCFALAQHQFFYSDIFDKNNGLTAAPKCMVEDNDGFLWIGTDQGLFRFDGGWARKINFAPADSLTNEIQKINSLAIDTSKSILWVGTSDGIFKFHWRTGASERLAAEKFFLKSAYKFPSCFRIFRDREGEIWANFAVQGVSHLINEGERIEHFTAELAETASIEKPSFANANFMQCFAQDALQDSIIWAGTKAGLIRFNKTNGSIRHIYYSHVDPVIVRRVNVISTLFAHSNGKLYLGSYNGGLLEFDPATEQFVHFLPHPEISLEKERGNNIDFILAHSATQLCIARSDEILLFEIKTRQFRTVTASGDLHFKDKAGNFWGFMDEHLVLYHRIKNQIHRIPFPNDLQYKTPEILRAWEDTSTQVIYFRAAGLKGMPVYDRRKDQWEMLRFPGGQPIVSGHVLEKIEAGILVNDIEQFYLLPPGARKFRPFPLNIPKSAGLLLSRKAPDGSVFISGLKGYVFWLKPGAHQVQTYSPAQVGEPLPEHFTSLNISTFDADGRVWFHCYGGYSIFSPKENRFTHFPIQGQRNRHFAQYRDFKLDKLGRMWCIGFNEFGWIDPKHPEEALHQRFGSINDIKLEDLSGGFYLARSDRLWFKNAKDMVSLELNSFNFTLFEGFGSEKPSLLDGGQLAFLNPLGIGLMHPDSLRPNLESPRPYLAWFKVFEKEKSIEGNLFAPLELRLNPDENFLSIGFSALGFFDASKFRFAYRLEGVDKDWVFPEAGIRFASYTGLKGGDHVFYLKVSNSQGKWIETPLQWRIHLGTFWWQTWWFRILGMAALAAFVYFLIKNRFRQQQILLENQRLLLEKEHALRRERDRIASEMHDDLGAGLSIIRLLSLAAKSHETNPVKSARIDRIAQSAAGMMEKMADIIWVMNSRNDSLDNFAAYLHRYAGEYLETHVIKLIFEISDKLPSISLSGEQRRGLLLAVKECLHNVAKHAGATEVKLLFSSGSPLMITIKDNGKGIPTALLKRFAEGDQTLIGNGLYNLRQRMEALGGGLTIENDNGTCVKLKTGIVWP